MDYLGQVLGPSARLSRPRCERETLGRDSETTRDAKLFIFYICWTWIDRISTMFKKVEFGVMFSNHVISGIEKDKKEKLNRKNIA
jgi:hypothetical protein